MEVWIFIRNWKTWVCSNKNSTPSILTTKLAHSGGKTLSYPNATSNTSRTTSNHPYGKKSDDGQERLRLPETEQERWNYSSHKYQARTSSLGTYKCWKCKRVGHLPEDCTAFLGVAAPSPDNPNHLAKPLPDHLRNKESAEGIYAPELKRLYPHAYFTGKKNAILNYLL